jgi:hypothetical protein
MGCCDDGGGRCCTVPTYSVNGGTVGALGQDNTSQTSRNAMIMDMWILHNSMSMCKSMKLSIHISIPTTLLNDCEETQ